MSTSAYVAQAIIAVAFFSFFVMAYLMYAMFTLKAWRAMFMSMAVLLILIAIMKRSTDIITAQREQAIIGNPENPEAKERSR